MCFVVIEGIFRTIMISGFVFFWASRPVFAIWGLLILVSPKFFGLPWAVPNASRKNCKKTHDPTWKKVAWACPNIEESVRPKTLQNLQRIPTTMNTKTKNSSYSASKLKLKHETRLSHELIELIPTQHHCTFSSNLFQQNITTANISIIKSTKTN